MGVFAGDGRPVRVDADDLRRRLPAQPAKQPLLGEQDRHTRIGDHELQTLVRISRIERDVGATSLERAEQRDDHLQRTFHEDADQRFEADRSGQKVTGELIGAGVELAIGDRVGAEHRGNRIGPLLGLRFEQSMDGGKGRAGSGRPVPFDEDLLPLL